VRHAHSPTVERLRALGLTAMADTLIELHNNPQAAEMPHATGSACSSIAKPPFATTAVSRAAWPPPSSVRPPPSRTSTTALARGLDRALFQALATSHGCANNNHLAIIGPDRYGQSPWLACALGNKACRDGFLRPLQARIALVRRPRSKPAVKDACRA